MAEVRHTFLSFPHAEVQKPTGVFCFYTLEQMSRGIAPNFPHRLVSNMSRFPSSQDHGTKELGGTDSLKPFFFFLFVSSQRGIKKPILERFWLEQPMI